MAKRAKPRVNTSCVAGRYAGTRERIVEFGGDTADQGGLIAFRITDDGKMRVEIYRQGKDVEVSVGKVEQS